MGWIGVRLKRFYFVLIYVPYNNIKSLFSDNKDMTNWVVNFEQQYTQDGLRNSRHVKNKEQITSILSTQIHTSKLSHIH